MGMKAFGGATIGAIVIGVLCIASAPKASAGTTPASGVRCSGASVANKQNASLCTCPYTELTLTPALSSTCVVTDCPRGHHMGAQPGDRANRPMYCVCDVVGPNLHNTYLPKDADSICPASTGSTSKNGNTGGSGCWLTAGVYNGGNGSCASNGDTCPAGYIKVANGSCVPNLHCRSDQVQVIVNNVNVCSCRPGLHEVITTTSSGVEVSSCEPFTLGCSSSTWYESCNGGSGIQKHDYVCEGTSGHLVTGACVACPNGEQFAVSSPIDAVHPNAGHCVVVPCPGNQTRDSHGVCGCNDPLLPDMFGSTGQCLPKCTGGQSHDSATGQCVCPAGQSLVNGACSSGSNGGGGGSGGNGGGSGGNGGGSGGNGGNGGGSGGGNCTLSAVWHVAPQNGVSWCSVYAYKNDVQFTNSTITFGAVKQPTECAAMCQRSLATFIAAQGQSICGSGSVVTNGGCFTNDLSSRK